MDIATAIGTVLDSGRQLDTRDPIKVYFTPAGGTWTEGGTTYTSSGWNTYEIEQAMLALEQWSNVADISFVRTTNANAADFVLNTTNLSGNATGYFYLPGNYFEAGIGVFDNQYGGWASNAGGGLEQGGDGFVLLLHEFGHGMGLVHPHADNVSTGSFPGVDSSHDTGHHDLNQGANTVMSYIDGWSSGPMGATSSYHFGHAGTPMAFDIAVVQAIYGPNTTHASGNNDYLLPSSNTQGTYYSSIWDTGGADTIRNGSSSNSVIDLRPATLQVEEHGGGHMSYVDGIHGGFTIAHGVTIENATGGGGRDTLIGNTADNTLMGNGGNDTLFDVMGNDILRGGAGNDILEAQYGVNIVIGGQGNDHVKGGSQSDLLRGEAGNDAIQGEMTSAVFGGSDKIFGGKGNDVLMGGTGADEFVFFTNDGSDIIGTFSATSVNLNANQVANVTSADFVPGLDEITLKGFSADVQNNVMDYVTIQNGNAVFSASGTEITFYQVTGISADDFNFA